MDRLAARDVRSLLDFVGKIYRLRNLEGFVKTLLAALPLLVPADVMSFSDVRPDESLSKNWTNPAGVVTPALNEVFQRYIGGHPVLVHNITTGDGRAVRFADFMSHRKHQGLAMYCEFFRPLGVEDGLCTALAISAPGIVGIGLHRDTWSFTERDKLVMDLLRPHLVHAWRNARAVERLQVRTGLIGKALELTDRGVVALDPFGRIRFATPRARGMIEEFFGRFSGRRLPEVLDRWRRHQELFIACKELARPPDPFEMVRDGKRLAVRLIVDGDVRWMLFGCRVTEIRPTSLEPLGLTRSEAEILAWVTQGKTNKEIATALGKSPRTVQKHLERIFSRLGVETRTAAAAVALQALSSSDSQPNRSA